MGQTYSQLTEGERNQFYALRQAKMPMNEIAYQLDRSRTTLYNELERNTGGRGYRSRQAQKFAEQSQSEKVQPLKMRPEVTAYIESKLQLQWAPEQIASTMKTDPNAPGLSVSHETIYRYVGDDKRAGGTLYTQLRHGLKKRRKRRGGKDLRLAEKEGREISPWAGRGERSHRGAGVAAVQNVHRCRADC